MVGGTRALRGAMQADAARACTPSVLVIGNGAGTPQAVPVSPSPRKPVHMRILLTNAYLMGRHGTATSVYAMYCELLRQGHEVEVWSPRPGPLSRSMRSIRVLKGKTYDLALVNHNVCLDRVVWHAVAPRVIFTAHGVLPKVEQPRPGAHRYVAISERVQDHLLQNGFQATVIRNGVDLATFHPITLPRRRLRRLGFLSNHYRGRPIIQRACENFGCDCQVISGVHDVAKAINACDAIATIGRGAIESLACGRPLLIFDFPTLGDQPLTDGWFRPEIGPQAARWNYTGWYRRTRADAAVLRALLGDFDPNDGSANRKYAVENHNIRDAAAAYLRLAQEM